MEGTGAAVTAAATKSSIGKTHQSKKKRQATKLSQARVASATFDNVLARLAMDPPAPAQGPHPRLVQASEALEALEGKLPK